MQWWTQKKWWTDGLKFPFIKDLVNAEALSPGSSGPIGERSRSRTETAQTCRGGGQMAVRGVHGSAGWDDGIEGGKEGHDQRGDSQ